jgi:hypothetical protein
MSFVAEILLELVGEAIFSRLQRPFDWFCKILNIWILLLIWVATPLVEWAVFRFAHNHNSTASFLFTALVAIGWPTFAVLFSIVLFQRKTKGPIVSA